MGPDRYVRVNDGWAAVTDSPVAGERVFENDGGGLTAVEVDPFALSVEVRPATDVSLSSATLHGAVTALSNVDGADVHFSWIRAGESPPASETGTRTLGSTGTFSETVSGLDPGTTYEFRAVAQARGESVSSGVDTFTTNG